MKTFNIESIEGPDKFNIEYENTFEYKLKQLPEINPIKNLNSENIISFLKKYIPYITQIKYKEEYKKNNLIKYIDTIYNSINDYFTQDKKIIKNNKLFLTYYTSLLKSYFNTDNLENLNHKINNENLINELLNSINNLNYIINFNEKKLKPFINTLIKLQKNLNEDHKIITEKFKHNFEFKYLFKQITKTLKPMIIKELKKNKNSNITEINIDINNIEDFNTLIDKLKNEYFTKKTKIETKTENIDETKVETKLTEYLDKTFKNYEPSKLKISEKFKNYLNTIDENIHSEELMYFIKFTKELLNLIDKNNKEYYDQIISDFINYQSLHNNKLSEYLKKKVGQLIQDKSLNKSEKLFINILNEKDNNQIKKIYNQIKTHLMNYTKIEKWNKENIEQLIKTKKNWIDPDSKIYIIIKAINKIIHNINEEFTPKEKTILTKIIEDNKYIEKKLNEFEKVIIKNLTNKIELLKIENEVIQLYQLCNITNSNKINNYQITKGLERLIKLLKNIKENKQTIIDLIDEEIKFNEENENWFGKLIKKNYNKKNKDIKINNQRLSILIFPLIIEQIITIKHYHHINIEAFKFENISSKKINKQIIKQITNKTNDQFEIIKNEEIIKTYELIHKLIKKFNYKYKAKTENEFYIKVLKDYLNKDNINENNLYKFKLNIKTYVSKLIQNYNGIIIIKIYENIKKDINKIIDQSFKETGFIYYGNKTEEEKKETKKTNKIKLLPEITQTRKEEEKRKKIGFFFNNNPFKKTKKTNKIKLLPEITQTRKEEEKKLLNHQKFIKIVKKEYKNKNKLYFEIKKESKHLNLIITTEKYRNIKTNIEENKLKKRHYKIKNKEVIIITIENLDLTLTKEYENIYQLERITYTQINKKIN